MIARIIKYRLLFLPPLLSDTFFFLLYIGLKELAMVKECL